MEDKTTQGKSQAPQQPQGRPCPQDCGKCGPWQQMYCCTKMVFELSKNLQAARAEVEQLRTEISELKSHIPTQIDELINPEIAQ